MRLYFRLQYSYICYEDLLVVRESFGRIYFFREINRSKSGDDLVQQCTEEITQIFSAEKGFFKNYPKFTGKPMWTTTSEHMVGKSK